MSTAHLIVDRPVATQLSLVLPVRDCQGEIRWRVETLIESLKELGHENAEVIVVDDGSGDATGTILERLQATYRQVRLIRHGRPRGLEAAGQTGLERATGEIVFIQETNSTVRISDFLHLLSIADDPSVIAARAESKPEALAPALLRRLRAWGTDADRQILSQVEGQSGRSPQAVSSLQMVRRPHLQRLSGPKGERYRMQGDTSRIASIELV